MREAVIARLGWARGLLRASHTGVVGRALRAEMSDLKLLRAAAHRQPELAQRI
ncbi:hypothetical protein [Actinokineospora globicatena]|uniref:hypothetical protein n=1 Tax=Actinokineospora globicatena TaxID=103729 RepID=UPI002555838A|nr:hypothetical protein [Actinokineospora globicatena]